MQIKNNYLIQYFYRIFNRSQYKKIKISCKLKKVGLFLKKNMKII